MPHKNFGDPPTKFGRKTSNFGPYFSAFISTVSGHYVSTIKVATSLVRSTFPSRLIKWASNVRPPVRPFTKCFFDFNEIWYVGRGRRVMHDSMAYDPIQGQGQGHEPLKIRNLSIFNGISSPIYNGTGKWPRILKLVYHSRIFNFCPS